MYPSAARIRERGAIYTGYTSPGGGFGPPRPPLNTQGVKTVAKNGRKKIARISAGSRILSNLRTLNHMHYKSGRKISIFRTSFFGLKPPYFSLFWCFSWPGTCWGSSLTILWNLVSPIFVDFRPKISKIIDFHRYFSIFWRFRGYFCWFPFIFVDSRWFSFFIDFGVKKIFCSKTHLNWRAAAFSSMPRLARRNFAYYSIKIT